MGDDDWLEAAYEDRFGTDADVELDGDDRFDVFGDEEDDMDVKYPHVKVRLVGEDGNAFMILGKVAKALQRAGVSPDEIGQYRQEAMSGDYNNLLAVTMRWVEVE